MNRRILHACLLIVALLGFSTAAHAQSASAFPYAKPVPNDTSTGTTQFTLTKINSSGNAVIMASTDTNGFAGICVSNCGKSGTAWIAFAGLIPLVMENTTTTSHYVTIGSTTGGDGHDTGASTYPNSGAVIGRVQSGATSGNVAMVDLFHGEIQASAGSTLTADSVSAPRACVAASGSGSAYTCTTSPTFTPAAHDEILFKADVANTGAATINVDSSSAAAVKKQGGGTALIANDFLAGQWVVLIFDGTNWQMQGQTGNASAGGGVSSFSGDTGGLYCSNSSSTGAVTCTAATQTAGSVLVGSTTNAAPAPGASAVTPSFELQPEPSMFLDPASWWSFFDDFDVSFNSTTAVGRMNWSQAGVGNTGSFIDNQGANAVGVFQCAVAATASDNCLLLLNQAGSGSFMGTMANYTKGRVKIRVKLSQTTNTNFFVGFVNPNSGHGEGTANYVGIGYNVGKSDTGWMCVVDNGTATRTAISGTLDTNWHDLMIRWTAAKTIACSVDGGTETTLATTNFPTDTNETPEMAIDNNATTNAVSFQVDYWMQALGGLSR